MRSYPARRDPNRPPMHPGALLADILPNLGRTKPEIAAALGMSPRRLNGILSERVPLSARAARRLGKLCGNGPGLWLSLQGAHDAHFARG